MNSNIETEKVDFSSGAELLQELYNGKRQCIECKWDDFFNIPLTKGYNENTNREYDFNSLKDLSNNTIPPCTKET